MAWPTIEDVSREFIRRVQVELSPHADAYGAGPSDGTAIEVVATADDLAHGVRAGDPVEEVQDRPKVSIFGPAQTKSVNFGGYVKDRVLISKNTAPDQLSYVDAPLPSEYDLAYTLVGWSARDFETGDGLSKGMQWLMQKLTLFGSGDNLLGSGWTTDRPPDAPTWRGYYFEFTDEPKRLPGSSASLHAMSATIVVRRVKLTDGSQGSGPLVGTTIVNPTIDT